jgi:hypothetical protein
LREIEGGGGRGHKVIYCVIPIQLTSKNGVNTARFRRPSEASFPAPKS